MSNVDQQNRTAIISLAFFGESPIRRSYLKCVRFFHRLNQLFQHGATAEQIIVVCTSSRKRFPFCFFLFLLNARPNCESAELRHEL